MYFNYIEKENIIQVTGGKIMIIVLCGKSCSGKTTLANDLIHIYGGNGMHLNIDKIGHQALEVPEIKERLVETFGNITTEGKVDRRKLSSIVFSSTEAMEKLTSITWGYMEQEIDKILEINHDKIMVLDWQLLPKTKFFKDANIRILLDVPYEVRKKRAMERDHITEEVFDLREQASIQYDNTSFDFVLNEIHYERLKEMVKKI